LLTLRKNNTKHSAVVLGRLVQNIIYSRYLVTEPWTMSCSRRGYKCRKYLGLTLYLASSLLGTVGTPARAWGWPSSAEIKMEKSYIYIPTYAFKHVQGQLYFTLRLTDD